MLAFFTLKMLYSIWEMPSFLLVNFFGYFKYYNLSTNNVRRGPIKFLGQWLCPIVGRVVASDTRGPGFESAKII